MQCDSCDNCLEPREIYDGTLPAQKFLSCVYRIRQASRFGVGMNHAIEVLTGAQTEKILRWQHDQLSTYGIGKEFSRPQWAAVGRELLRLGYLRQSEGNYPTLEVSESGLETLTSRKSVTLTKPLVIAKTKRAVHREGEITCDEILFTRLRELRKKLADERKVPAYVIFGDATLRQIARAYPETKQAMTGIFGMGEKKLAEFGEIFADAVASYLKTNTRVEFTD